jgi:trehalose 6-phosphate synthase/phosphatase
MNLVAKEFVATRTDEDGVLVLSEFAGAAAELGEAVHVNPYAIAATAGAMYTALSMEHAERGARMRALRARVSACDVHAWAAHFLFDLRAAEVSRLTTSSLKRQPAGCHDGGTRHAHANAGRNQFVA